MTGSVAFVLPSLRGGGAEFVTREWVQELVRRGYDARVVLLAAEDDEPVLEAPVDRLAKKGAGRSEQMRALRQYLLEVRPLAAVSMMTRSNFQLLSVVQSLPRAVARPKVVISERNMPFVEKTDSWPHRIARSAAFRALYPRADLFIAISHPVGAAFQVIANLTSDKIWVVPNPAVAKSGVGSAMRGELGSSITLAVPGRLVDKKRPLLALDVAEELLKSFSKVKVEYFGEGPLLQDLPSRRGPIEVVPHGRVENWYDHVASDAVVLLPSAVEGFGNVLVEAASRNVPSVVGSSAFGSADAVIPGVTGFFARNDSVAEFARAAVSASRLRSATPPGWLDQFSLASSTDVVERALLSVASDLSPVCGEA